MGCSKYDRVSELTKRENDIVKCIVKGMSNEEIANLLNISVGTVKIHVHNILQKKEMKRRVDVILEALANGRTNQRA
ncbi:MAG: two-component system, NarL family, nitrate/nitrite response regulator NarL [Clostridiales bacterium]|jgi:two-component system NarL family response regulator|nr:two-component system, NarL family, nitrate/nitrite response regulator NarL [Clostridiales bacterium]MDK2902699.1 two-component system, NarL family, nitrate/nitrite response regulator NarL [Clostridiales bacterium]MDK2992283.1 two-component system, NarL family, nitrate/nitrite response regulator NarL [Clostridiales bacterium]